MFHLAKQKMYWIDVPVKKAECCSRPFKQKFIPEVHQGAVFSPLSFVIVLKALLVADT